MLILEPYVQTMELLSIDYRNKQQKKEKCRILMLILEPSDQTMELLSIDYSNKQQKKKVSYCDVYFRTICVDWWRKGGRDWWGWC
jgi:hypothetical protein